MSVNIPIENAGYLNVQGLQIAVASNTTATVQLGQARDSTNVNDIVLTAAVTLNAATNGINGLDSGSLANATLYAFFAVGDSTQNNTPGVLLSTSATAPLLPVGYDMFRLIGYLRTDGSAHFLTGFWYGSANERIFMYAAPIATAITAGNATTYTAITLTNFVPAAAVCAVWLAYSFTPGAASRTLKLTPSASTGDAVTVTGQVTSVVCSGNALVLDRLISGVPKIDYKVANSGDAVAINVAGYQYTI